MNITADANVLIRAVTQDDPAQAMLALEAMRDAKSIALTIASLCEFVWVLDRQYKRPRANIAQAVRELIGDHRVLCDLPAVQAGLSFLEMGGDFADGVIAFDGRRLNAGVFVTFDRQAAQLVIRSNGEARLLADRA